jgi:iron complex outermembrane receptor protein
VELVDRQSEVADYNGELPTPGYALLHLRAGYTFREHLSVDVALENVFDENYADHLGGINRVLASDVPVGAHIPGAGRFVSVSVNYKF